MGKQINFYMSENVQTSINKMELNMEYEMMIPPFKHGKFADMQKKEVQKYFDWYIS